MLIEQLIRDLASPIVMEAGTRRSKPDSPTHHQRWAPHAERYIMVDAFDGIDVDVVNDVEVLDAFEDASVDVFIAVSLLEHVPRPWRAAEAIARVVRPGGLIYIDAPQAFPIHGYPDDYFRFSTSAMTVLFGDDRWETLDLGYVHPAIIQPEKPVEVWNDLARGYLNTCLTARRRP